MRQFWTWLVIAFLIIGLVLAGTSTYRNSVRLSILDDFDLPELNPEEPDAEEILAQAKFAIEEAKGAVDMAFNLLGIFEALGLVITIGGVSLTAFGLTRFTTAQNELEKARKDVLKSVSDAHEGFNKAIAAREAELQSLREELQQDAQNDRQRTSDALLANALIPLGERQYRTSDYKGALTTYNRALQLDSENPVIHQRLGYVYVQRGELDKAKKHYEKAIDLEKDFAPALAGLGYVHRRLGEKMSFDDLPKEEEEAYMIERDRILTHSEDLLLQALAISPKLVDDDDESYWGILGGLYKRRGQVEQAILAYKKTVEVTPQSSYGYVNLALMYQKQGRYEEMLETYEKVEQIASKEADAVAGNFWGYSDLIASSYAVGKVEQAESSLPIAISIAPEDSPYMLEGLADTLRELEKALEPEKIPPIEKAIKILEDEMAERSNLDSE